jgi:hypothetical protein
MNDPVFETPAAVRLRGGDIQRDRSLFELLEDVHRPGGVAARASKASDGPSEGFAVGSRFLRVISVDDGCLRPVDRSHAG